MFEAEVAHTIAAVGLTAIAVVKGVTMYSAYKSKWYMTSAACAMSLLFLAAGGLYYGVDAVWPYVQQGAEQVAQSDWQEGIETFLSRPPRR